MEDLWYKEKDIMWAVILLSIFTENFYLCILKSKREFASKYGSQ